MIKSTLRKIRDISPIKISGQRALKRSLNEELLKLFRQLKPGIVLDAGGGAMPYKNDIPHTKILSLDIDKKFNPDILSDIHNIKWQSNYFDTLICTEVLEHCYNPQQAVDEMFRILKKGGVCILSTRFIHNYHPCPKDYFRFSHEGLGYLFRKFRKVKIIPQGNRIQIFWDFLNIKEFWFLNLFNPIFARINFKDNILTGGFVVYAVK